MASSDCSACGRPLREGARFCSHCGGEQLPDGVFAATQPAGLVEADAALAHGRQRADIRHAGGLFGVLLATSLIAGLAGSAGDLPRHMLVGGLVDLAIVLVFVVINRGLLAPLLAPWRPGLRQLAFLLGVCLAFIAAFTGYFALLKATGLPWSSLVAGFTRQGWPVWSMLLLISLLPAVTEELAFRGVIQARLERVMTFREAWFIQAALFSVIHLSPLMFPSHFVMGLCLGWLRTRFRSLYPAMVLHAVWNGWVVLEELSLA